MAVNALLYTWTERGKLLPSTPSEVVEVVRAAADWLKENSLTGKFRPLNAVFSGSVKSIEVSFTLHHLCHFTHINFSVCFLFACIN